MIFQETEPKGACVVGLERREDDRGFFARSWCRREFEAHGLNPRIAQCDVSFTARKGTLRGMHFQVKPFEEAKLVRCTMGSLCDVIVDLRRDSPTFKRHLSVVLTAENRTMLYVPEGFAHGFLTLEDNTEVHYQISEFHAPDHARGFRWNDPAFGIAWPADVKVISERDRNYPDFNV
ncbi:MAG: dTDP-4-dehydrorhamnose 3,5-epimerase [Candidatus Aminicenantes bacterium RBG_19FT_COMBO_58_17]|nr:MAG: dTDP-4-dehydrorhamnose 3,5-epimerase [Candidatus Aminicenantes bacterium RBG_19FT_COMBO_58_17]